MPKAFRRADMGEMSTPGELTMMKWIKKNQLHLCMAFAASFQLWTLYVSLYSCISPLKVLIMVSYLTIFWTKTQISRLLYCMENHLNSTWPKSMLLFGFRLLAILILSTQRGQQLATLRFPKRLLSLCVFSHAGLTKTGAQKCGHVAWCSSLWSV